MNIMQLPTFDDSLADAAKLAAVRQIVEQATGFAEAQIKKSHEPTEWQDPGMHYANIAGILDATVDGLVAYLGQIALTCRPDDPLPHLDDLDDWYDHDGTPNPKGAYDAHGHHFAERDGRIGYDF